VGAGRRTANDILNRYMFNWRTLGFGLLFGTIDSVGLSLVKYVHGGASKLWMSIPFIGYAAIPFIFLKALEHESLTIMNLVLDMSSDLMITIVGLFVFAERLSPMKLLGVMVSFLGLFLMTYESVSWNGYLSSNFPILNNFA
jgi:multidrug transporter EmrE-like cation transporter